MHDKAVPTELPLNHTDFDRLFTSGQQDLRDIARRTLRPKERALLQTTALVNEAYLKLRQGQPRCDSVSHFFALAARAMRFACIDHVRRETRSKRGGDSSRVVLDLEQELGLEGRTLDAIALGEALEALGNRTKRQLRVMELRLFGGLPAVDVAEVLSISPRTVERESAAAVEFLGQRLIESHNSA